jgi:cytochrome c-type biogenesis protein
MALGDGFGEVAASGSLLLAVPVAAAAGLVSFLSPCIVPLVPGYLSLVTGLTGAELAGRDAAAPGPQEPRRGSTAVVTAPAVAVQRSRVVLGTLLFVLGFTAVFVSYGLLLGGLGGLLREHQDVIVRVLGAVTILLGLAFAGWLPGLSREWRLHGVPRVGLAGAPMLGVLFGLGWTPCIGPTLAAVQTLAFTEGSAARGALLSAAYCVGLGLPFLLAGLAYRRALGALGWVRRHQLAIMRAGGVLLVVLGVLLVTGLWGELVGRLQGWIGGFEVVV